MLLVTLQTARNFSTTADLFARRVNSGRWVVSNRREVLADIREALPGVGNASDCTLKGYLLLIRMEGRHAEPVTCREVILSALRRRRDAAVGLAKELHLGVCAENFVHVMRPGDIR